MSVVNIICEYCSPNIEVIINFSALPFFEPIIENKNTCSSNFPQYEKERLHLNQVEKDPIKSINDFKNALTCISRTHEIASFLRKCHNIRFPEDVIAATKVGIRSPQVGNRRLQRRTDKNCSMITSYPVVDRDRNFVPAGTGTGMKMKTRLVPGFFQYFSATPLECI